MFQDFIEAEIGVRAEPDLSKPSIRGLAWLLRHPERWPVGFEFDYGQCSRCAMGLAAQVWPTEVLAPTPIWMSALGIGYDEAHASRWPCQPIQVGFNFNWHVGLSPEAIAADLDNLAA